MESTINQQFKIITFSRSLFADFQSSLCPSLLTDTARVRLHALTALCMWCGYDLPHMVQTTTIGSDIDQSSTKEKLETLLNEDMLDPDKPADLQLVTN